MFKRTLFLVGFLVAFFVPYAQTIDSLRTDEEVLAFIRKHDGPEATTSITAFKPVFGDNTWKKQVKQLKAVTYEKADFDQNGHADLLFNGFYEFYNGNSHCNKIAIVVLSFGKDSFQFRMFPGNYGQAIATAKVIEIGSKPHIQLLNKRYFYNQILNKSEIVEKIDTLLYAYNNFVELSRPVKQHIEKVSFKVKHGIGVENDFTLTLTPDSTILIAEEGFLIGDMFDLGGTFITNLGPSLWAAITDQLQYIRFTELENQYICHCTDAGNITLSISYDGGKVKNVSDQGGRGTYGLVALNELLYNLKHTQQWKRANLQSLKIGNLYCDEQVLSFVKLLNSTYAGLTIARPRPVLR